MLLKKPYVISAVTTLVIGILIWEFAGGLLRYYGGDVVVIIFLYSCLTLVASKWSTIARVGSVVALACGIEVYQLVANLSAQQQSGIEELLIGSTFDYIDVIVYMVTGVGIVATERVFKKTS